MNRKCKLFGIGLLTGFLCFQCGNNDNIAGNAVQTGNAKGKLSRSDGTPAAGVTVYFYDVDNNPRTGLSKVMAATDSTVTDSNGAFTDSLPDGQYNMIAGDDSTGVYQDSVEIAGDTAIFPDDTLKPFGSLAGVVRLQPGHDSRKVFLLVMGTNKWAVPSDPIGNFSFQNMAEGQYTARILSTLDDYAVLDTSFKIMAGKVATLSDTIFLHYTGIPVPQGLTISYDTLKQLVTLTWNTPTTGRSVQGYNVYRKHSDSTSFQKMAAVISGTSFIDSTAYQDQTYQYKVAAVDTTDAEGTKSEAKSVTAIGAFSVSDTIFTISQLGTPLALQIDKVGNYVLVNGIGSVVQSTKPARIERYSHLGVLINSWDIPGGIEGNYTYNNIAIHDTGSIFAVTKTNEILEFDTAGNLRSQFQFPGTVRGFTIFKDTLFVGDREAHKILAYTINGDSLYSWGTDGIGNGQFKTIVAITTDARGRLYVEDLHDNARIQAFEKTGTFLYSVDLGSLDIVSVNLDVSGNLITISPANSLYAFDATTGSFEFVCKSIPNINKVIEATTVEIIAFTWEGHLIRLRRFL